MDTEEIIVEEYKALRGEIILCLERRVAIISMGLTAIAVFAGAGLAAIGSQHEHWFISGIVFALGLPITSLYVMRVWLAETRRLRRASLYNWYLELKLQKLKGSSPKPLEWEQMLREKGPYQVFKEHYRATANMFYAAALAGGLCGAALFARAVYLSRITQPYKIIWWGVLFAATAGFCIWLKRRFSHCKSELQQMSTTFDRPPQVP